MCQYQKVHLLLSLEPGNVIIMHGLIFSRAGGRDWCRHDLSLGGVEEGRWG
jgi:hypothetical protein